MDKVKIVKLCNDIEDIAMDIRARTMNDSYFQAQTIIDKARQISAEISEKPLTNGDRIRQMTVEELADKLIDKCAVCAYRYAECEEKFCLCEEGVGEWLKQEVREDAGSKTD